jgi:hypothetical protein
MGHDLIRKPEDHFSGSCLWSKPPLGLSEKTVALNPGTARKFARDFRIRRQAAYSRYRVSIPGRVKPEHRGDWAKVNGAGAGSVEKA